MEQPGFRKIIDSSFIMASMVSEDADLEDVKNTFVLYSKPNQILILDLKSIPITIKKGFLKDFKRKWIPDFFFQANALSLKNIRENFL